MLRIGGIEKCSLSDCPGMVSAVVFTAGCSWNCWYCHNRAVICGSAVVEEEEVLSFLAKRRGLLDAVVVSGGEPTLQEDLHGFLRAVRAMGFFVKLDTNGSRPDAVQQILDEGLAEYIAVDFKAPMRLYMQTTGHSGEAVPETLCRIRKARIPFEVRTTMIPAIREAELREMMEEAGPVPRWALQLYLPPDGSAPPRSAAELRGLAEVLRDAGPEMLVRA